MTARPLLLVPAAALLFAACSSKQSSGSATTRPAPFAYHRSAPIALRDAGVLNTGWPKIHDVSYASPKGGRVPAYLFVPRGRGPHPAVIWMHGTGGDRRELLVPAAWLGARGAVGLTISAPEARTPRPRIPVGAAGLERSRELTIQNVVDLRRAVDLLVARPDVDPKRIAFVGFSAGARTGAILAGVEHRIRAFDLMSGGALPVAQYAQAAPPALRARVRRDLRDVDPLRQIAHAAPSKLFLQDGRRDSVVPRTALDGLIRSASKPKQVRWYDADHGLNEQALRDQRAWLTRELGLRPQG